MLVSELTLNDRLNIHQFQACKQNLVTPPPAGLRQKLSKVIRDGTSTDDRSISCHVALEVAARMVCASNSHYNCSDRL